MGDNQMNDYATDIKQVPGEIPEGYRIVRNDEKLEAGDLWRSKGDKTFPAWMSLSESEVGVTAYENWAEAPEEAEWFEHIRKVEAP